jgi:hypothetical protein
LLRPNPILRDRASFGESAAQRRVQGIQSARRQPDYRGNRSAEAGSGARVILRLEGAAAGKDDYWSARRVINRERKKKLAFDVDFFFHITASSQRF